MSSTQPQQPTNFLTLPHEIRQRIFHETFYIVYGLDVRLNIWLARIPVELFLYIDTSANPALVFIHELTI